MKIEEIVSGKDDDQEIQLEGVSIPVRVLKALMKEGYVYLKPYRDNRTLSLWGKTCTACYSEEQIREMR